MYYNNLLSGSVSYIFIKGAYGSKGLLNFSHVRSFFHSNVWVEKLFISTCIRFVL